MKKRKQSPEQIIRLLRQAEVMLGQGERIEAVCRSLGIGQSSYYKWRKSYGGMNIDQAKRLKALEVENNRLKRAVADLTLDNQILKDVSTGKL